MQEMMVERVEEGADGKKVKTLIPLSQLMRELNAIEPGFVAITGAPDDSSRDEKDGREIKNSQHVK